MIRDERLDRVIVTTPDFTHADFVVRSLRAGADVVVEKPLTIDVGGGTARRRIRTDCSSTRRRTISTS